ncbi:MAG TPA: redoxin domain-containing protein [Pseudomonas xinjiangensis]|uniref:Redoxin domain-containing protein n=2 Tax=root TaxID=1 RepID=A0A7V1BP21_9GAMM|nr:redoxin domain-containing protein [Halopseudomonas xinjiangensis]HEC46327.1 redoxin domain-containing protein [Halopseudomonas xinjiangensis]
MSKRLFLMLSVLFMAGCGEQSWQTTDISGAMPELKFDLTDENGRTVSADDYRGKPTLLFFGFTNCPDVCPTTLAQLASASQQLDEELREDLQVLFVSVDPERDSPQTLRRYTDVFGPQFIGLTGDKAALDALTRRYSTTYSYGEEDQSGNYDVSHSGAVFVFNRHGDVRLLIRATDPMDAVAADLRRLFKDGA